MHWQIVGAFFHLPSQPLVGTIFLVDAITTTQYDE